MSYCKFLKNREKEREREIRLVLDTLYLRSSINMSQAKTNCSEVESCHLCIHQMQLRMSDIGLAFLSPNHQLCT